MATHPKTECADFFNGHAPAYEEKGFTKNTTAEADILVVGARASRPAEPPYPIMATRP